VLGEVPNVRAAAFRQSAKEVGVEGRAAVATSTTSATTLAGPAFNGLDGIAAAAACCATPRRASPSWWTEPRPRSSGSPTGWSTAPTVGACSCAARRRRHVRENAAGDVLASLTTMVWNTPSKSWTGGATMADASLNRRMTVRLGDAVALAQIGIVGLDGQIELEALRLYGLPEAAPALLCGTPTLPVGQREFAAETTLDLPQLAGGAVHLADVTVPGGRQGDRAEASLASSTRFIELDAFVWSNNTARVMARNVSGGAFDLAAATLSVAVIKRRIP